MTSKFLATPQKQPICHWNVWSVNINPSNPSELHSEDNISYAYETFGCITFSHFATAWLRLRRIILLMKAAFVEEIFWVTMDKWEILMRQYLMILCKINYFRTWMWAQLKQHKGTYVIFNTLDCPIGTEVKSLSRITLVWCHTWSLFYFLFYHFYYITTYFTESPSFISNMQLSHMFGCVFADRRRLKKTGDYDS